VEQGASKADHPFQDQGEQFLQQLWRQLKIQLHQHQSHFYLTDQ
jgi:hypothetical protein